MRRWRIRILAAKVLVTGVIGRDGRVPGERADGFRRRGLLHRPKTADQLDHDFAGHVFDILRLRPTLKGKFVAYDLPDTRLGMLDDELFEQGFGRPVSGLDELGQ